MEELLLMWYIFGLFWMVRRPNVLIFVGGVLAICMMVLLVVLMVSVFGRDPPLAVGGTATKLRAFFAIKTAFSGLAQLGCGILAIINLYSFPRAFNYANKYMFLALSEGGGEGGGGGGAFQPATDTSPFNAAEDAGSYVPPSYSESRSKNGVVWTDDDAVELESSGVGDVLSESRETNSM